MTHVCSGVLEVNHEHEVLLLIDDAIETESKDEAKLEIAKFLDN